MLKWDINKFYKTRCGQKVRLYDLYSGGDWPIHGARLISSSGGNENWVCLSWKDSGVYFPGKHDFDIVSEWEEPKKKYPRQFAYIPNPGGIPVFRLIDNDETLMNFGCRRAPWLDEPEGE